MIRNLKKSINVSACLVGLAFGATASFAAPKEIDSPIEKVFVPDGFDNNDNVEVVLYGHFPTSCYKVGNTTARVEGKTIFIHSTSYEYQRDPSSPLACADIVVPFKQVVKLGVVPTGTFTVKTERMDGREGKSANLKVKEAKVTSPDDFLYAPVSSVTFQKNGGEGTVELKGTFPMMFTGCMKMDKVQYSFTDGPVLVVQPIAKIAKTGECTHEDMELDFTYNFTVDGALPVGSDMLLHVRALDGNSVNKVVRVMQ